MEEWISVSNELPELYKDVLVYVGKPPDPDCIDFIHDNYGYKIVTFRKPVNKEYYGTDWIWAINIPDDYINFWMPLPKGPYD
jgi:hypothetical protein